MYKRNNWSNTRSSVSILQNGCRPNCFNNILSLFDFAFGNCKASIETLQENSDESGGAIFEVKFAGTGCEFRWIFHCVVVCYIK